MSIPLERALNQSYLYNIKIELQLVEVEALLTEKYKRRINESEVPNDNIKHFADSPPLGPDEVHLPMNQDKS